MIILYRDLLYYIVFYILYYLYLGGFHASDSLSLNGSHPDMLFNLYFFSVICRINIFLLLLLPTGRHRAWAVVLATVVAWYIGARAIQYIL